MRSCQRYYFVSDILFHAKEILLPNLNIMISGCAQNENLYIIYSISITSHHIEHFILCWTLASLSTLHPTPDTLHMLALFSSCPAMVRESGRGLALSTFICCKPVAKLAFNTWRTAQNDELLWTRVRVRLSLPLCRVTHLPPLTLKKRMMAEGTEPHLGVWQRGSIEVSVWHVLRSAGGETGRRINRLRE